MGVGWEITWVNTYEEVSDSIWRPSAAMWSFSHDTGDLALKSPVDKYKLEDSSNNTGYKLIKLNKESSNSSWGWTGYL